MLSHEQIRGHKVMLDADLAVLYSVPIKALNQAVKRNENRFPLGVMNLNYKVFQIVELWDKPPSLIFLILLSYCRFGCSCDLQKVSPDGLTRMNWHVTVLIYIN